MPTQPQATLQLQQNQKIPETPRTVIAAKKVDLVLVTYLDEYNQQQSQLAVVGENTVHLLESRRLGMSVNTTPQGIATQWLRDGVFKALGRK